MDGMTIPLLSGYSSFSDAVYGAIADGLDNGRDSDDFQDINGNGIPDFIDANGNGEYDSGEIKIDENEIAEANWYKVDNLPYVPPDTSLSGKLINSFVADHS